MKTTVIALYASTKSACKEKLKQGPLKHNKSKLVITTTKYLVIQQELLYGFMQLYQIMTKVYSGKFIRNLIYFPDTDLAIENS